MASNIDSADRALYENDPSSRKSPQGNILDYLIWDRLSKFWASAYRQEDREALNAIYEAAGRVIDAEHIRLEEINRSKSLFSCPILSQRRWVRFELDRYNELRSFLSFALRGELPGGSGYQNCSSAGDDTEGRTLNCTTSTINHAAHWHVGFSWTLSDTDATTRRTINLRYPIRPALTEIWRMIGGGSSRRVGVKMVYGIDYNILDDGCSIRLNEGEAGDVYDVEVGFDFTDRDTFDGRLPATRLAVSPHPGLRSAAVPPELDGFPVHLSLVFNPPPVISLTMQDTNNVSFTTEQVFIPNTGDLSTGASNVTPGVVSYPSSYQALTALDVAFAFGLERVEDGAAFTRLHAHETFSFYLTLGAAPLPSGSTSYVPPDANVTEFPLPNGMVPAGLSSSVDFLGQELRVFLGGQKLHRSEFSYISATNVIRLARPLVLTPADPVRVDVQYTREFEGTPTQTLDLHNHVSCYIQRARPVTEFDAFDDGGDFDYDSEESVEPPWGIFDSISSTSIIYLADVTADEATMRVYLNGELLARTKDYVTSVVPGTSTSQPKIRFVFAQDISGKTVEVTYRRGGSILAYGIEDILGTSSCLNGYLARDNAERVLGNVGALLNNFISVYGPVKNPGALIDSIRILAGGGNPLFVLFADEFNSYTKYSVDAPNQPLTAIDARTLESTNTQLAAIPIMVDHPHRPTVRIQQDEDFRVKNGSILTSRDLTKPRSADDMEPGVWWCPLLVLDERLLARTFGALVGDVRSVSTPEYRNALIANHLARFSGPVSDSIESAASVFLGSPVFQQDGRVVAVNSITTAYIVSVRGASAERDYTIEAGRDIPSVGSLVFAGQSIASPMAYQGTLTYMKSWTGGSLVIDGVFEVVQQGDLMWIEMFQAGTQLSTWVRLTVQSAYVRLATEDPTRQETVLTFVERVQVRGVAPNILSRVKASRPAGTPIADFDGSVDSIKPVRYWSVVTSSGETFNIPENVPIPYYVGYEVRRGEAVIKSFARMYDHAERPDWLWMKPEDDDSYQHLFTGGLVVPAGQDDSRYVSIEPAVGGISKMIPSRVDPLPPRGTKIRVTLDSTGLIEEYTVTGTNPTTLNVVPAVDSKRSGLAVFEWPAIGVRSGYFELPPSSNPGVSLAAPHAVGAAALLLQSTVGFPAAGRVGLVLGGGVLEVDYYRVNGNFLADLTWESLRGHEALIDDDGRAISTISAVPVVLLAEYTDRILNPAMEVLIKLRVEDDLGTTTGEPRITDVTAEEYYRLFKNNASVLELNTVGTPDSLRMLLEDVVPPSTTLVVMSRHVISDVYDAGATDG